MINRALHLKVFFADRNKKNVFKMIKEMVVYGWNKKELPTDYFRKFLYRKGIENYTDFLSLKQYYSIIESKKNLISDIAVILENKLSFDLFACKQGLPSTKTISYNIGNSFYYNSKVYQVFSKEELITFFSMVFNTSKQTCMFLKPISGSRGKDCFKIFNTEFSETLENLGVCILKGNYLHQEALKQHPEINKIHSESINTLRINTYLSPDGKPHLISALMRFGIGPSITDNVSTGGFYVNVDTKREELTGIGRQTIALGGKTYVEHPGSKIRLDGYKIPMLKDAISLAKEAATKVPTRIIGWDFAITDNGPIIIEGNTNPSLHMADVAYGGLCKHPLIQEILKDVKA